LIYYDPSAVEGFAGELYSGDLSVISVYQDKWFRPCLHLFCVVTTHYLRLGDYKEKRFAWLTSVET
jgi:hypothetical protein